MSAPPHGSPPGDPSSVGLATIWPDAGSPLTTDFWAGVDAGVLYLSRCTSCQRCFLGYPACPHCGSSEHASVAASGRGTLYSWTTTFAAFDPALADDVPYVVGIVDLAEGCRIPARIVVASPADLVAGVPVELAFVPALGHALWTFRG